MYLCSYVRVAKEEFTLRDLKKKQFFEDDLRCLTLKYLLFYKPVKSGYLQKSTKTLSKFNQDQIFPCVLCWKGHSTFFFAEKAYRVYQGPLEKWTSMLHHEGLQDREGPVCQEDRELKQFHDTGNILFLSGPKFYKITLTTTATIQAPSPAREWQAKNS